MLARRRAFLHAMPARCPRCRDRFLGPSRVEIGLCFVCGPRGQLGRPRTPPTRRAHDTTSGTCARKSCTTRLSAARLRAGFSLCAAHGRPLPMGRPSGKLSRRPPLWWKPLSFKDIRSGLTHPVVIICSFQEQFGTNLRFRRWRVLLFTVLRSSAVFQ